MTIWNHYANEIIDLYLKISADGKKMHYFLTIRILAITAVVFPVSTH